MGHMAERPAVAPLLCWGGIRQRAPDTTAVERAELQRKYACRRQRSTANLASADPSGVGWNGEMEQDPKQGGAGQGRAGRGGVEANGNQP